MAQPVRSHHLLTNPDADLISVDPRFAAPDDFRSSLGTDGDPYVAQDRAWEWQHQIHDAQESVFDQAEQEMTRDPGIPGYSEAVTYGVGSPLDVQHDFSDDGPGDTSLEQLVQEADANSGPFHQHDPSSEGPQFEQQMDAFQEHDPLAIGLETNQEGCAGGLEAIVDPHNALNHRPHPFQDPMTEQFPQDQMRLQPEEDDQLLQILNPFQMPGMGPMG